MFVVRWFMKFVLSSYARRPTCHIPESFESALSLSLVSFFFMPVLESFLQMQRLQRCSGSQPVKLENLKTHLTLIAYFTAHRTYMFFALYEALFSGYEDKKRITHTHLTPHTPRRFRRTTGSIPDIAKKMALGCAAKLGNQFSW